MNFAIQREKICIPNMATETLTRCTCSSLGWSGVSSLYTAPPTCAKNEHGRCKLKQKKRLVISVHQRSGMPCRRFFHPVVLFLTNAIALCFAAPLNHAEYEPKR